MTALRGWILVAAALLSLTGCASRPRRAAPAAAPSAELSASATPDPSPSPTPGATAPSACPPVDGWDCAMRARFPAAAAYLRTRPGLLGIEVQDRTSGAIWRSGATTHATWTGSTIKLAIAADLLARHRAGRIRLTANDRSLMDSMLKVSSNDAATELWNRYDGPGMLPRFRSTYGMATLSVVPGYVTFWRNLRCTAEDLRALMGYVLGRAHPDDRGYLVGALRGVADLQHWGVWSAGPAQRPGNKNGWAVKPDSGGEHWITHSVGFAGPGERYVVAVMYALPPSGTLAQGVHAVSDLVALVFGAPNPAPVTIPA
jgi:hypothetical protein